ncbi:type II toxin-antitoxin system RelE/ParE family toxin [Candidatus Woesearchaeota archaeon]|nr:type II toxin-antitoxin system RelE/ParE family toxin [Candidatus Woesearchaeota archaeon]
MYFVDLSQRADKFLDKLPNQQKERIQDRLKRLKDNPVPNDVKFIGRDGDGEKIFRYRIGDYRALYKIKDKEKIVLITKIDRRPHVYD